MQNTIQRAITAAQAARARPCLYARRRQARRARQSRQMTIWPALERARTLPAWIPP